MDEAKVIGTRIREVRAWRQLTIRVVADRAGISWGYLGRIERGEQPVNNRQTLEAVANALKVSPSELTGKPWAPTDPVGSDAHATLVGIERALITYELGVDPGGELRPWPEIDADVRRLVDLMHVHADYAAQGELAPVLMADLHAAYVRKPELRPEVLVALIKAYSSAMWTTKRLGGRGLPHMAAHVVQRCAELLEAPEWIGYSAWLRGDAVGSLNRDQQYRRSVTTAEALTNFLNNPDVLQMYGMLHLSASLAAGAQGNRDLAVTHLDEAGVIADRLDEEVGRFAALWFGRTNVGIWRTSLAAELGEGAAVAEVARNVHPELIPSPSRRAEFWCDLGRSLASEAPTREKGLKALLTAEQLAPQRVRNDVFVREAVADLLRTARHDAGGRELRGLAWRMGVAPVG